MKDLLIVIDLQKGWRHKSATEQAMLRTIDLCKKFSGDIIHCKFLNDSASLFHTQLRWKRFIGSPDIDDIPEIEELKLPVYWRSTYSCVTDELLPLLHAYDHIYIAGVFTDISVDITAMQLFDLGIPVTVISDCVGTLHGDDVHRAAIKSLGFSIGEAYVVPADTVLQQ